MEHLASILIPPLSKPYTYVVPAKIASNLEVGCRVEIPLGKRITYGFVVSIQTSAKVEPSLELKSIIADRPIYRCISPTDLPFLERAAQYYQVPLSNLIDTAVPSPLPPKQTQEIQLLQQQPELRGAKQREIVDWLAQQANPVSYRQTCQRFRGASPSLRTLAKRGVIAINSKIVVDWQQPTPPAWAKRSVVLSNEQNQANDAIIDKVMAHQHCPFLLHGITGSGKTEVYIEAIQAALSAGLGALVIVPEIALTPQLIDRFAARIGEALAVLHSGIKQRPRWEAWQALLNGEARVAIGARSAVFAPIAQLGLIIVDEEHDSSFKQSDSLRYHARDLAVMRAQLQSCPVVLGSATPSLESYYRAIERKYQYLPLKKRLTNTANTNYKLVDLGRKKPWEMLTPTISSELYEALANTLGAGDQAFILYNRRGFATYLQCPRCEAVIECPNCSVTLTYHQSHNELRCHYCNYRCLTPRHCPHCLPQPDSTEEPAVPVRRGAGTERVFNDLISLFPNAIIDRLDRDAAQSELALTTILNNVRSRQTQILVGTQMLAKGHDLPGVTLVGIIDCDVGLHLPDFRASERVFQLLTQASGRAGRGEQPGQVILQTRVPNHHSLRKTLEQDYRGFATTELRTRRELQYPPFTNILRIIASSSDNLATQSFITICRDELTTLSKDHTFTILGPSPAPITKLKTEWRWHLLLKSESVSALQAAIAKLQPIVRRQKRIKVAFDLDPQDLL